MPSNTYTAVTNKRDLSELITNISPTDTYLFSHMGRTKATQTYHEWMEDALGNPKDNAQPEGFTYFTQDVDDRNTLGNFTQIMSRGIHVTKTQEAVQHYGVKSEMAYQMQKTLKELAFDCEVAVIQQATQAAGAMGAPGVPRRFGGLPYWIVTNVFENGGTARPLTLDLISQALEFTYLAGGSPRTLLVSPRNKSIISRFTAGNTKYMKGSDTSLKTIISVLETDFGVLEVVPNRWMPNDKIYGLSMDYVKKAFLRPFQQGDVAPNIADLHRRNVVGEWTIEMRAEAAHFVIKDLNGILPVFP